MRKIPEAFGKHLPVGFQIEGYKLKRCLLGHLDPQIQGQNVLYAAEFISASLSSSLTRMKPANVSVPRPHPGSVQAS